MSTEPKKRVVRRDNDPIHVYGDGRLRFWPSGQVGVGPGTKTRRCGTRENAEIEATKLRKKFARTVGAGPKVSATLAQAAQDWLISLRAGKTPAGTIIQYKSNWNVWVSDTLGQTHCLDVELRHWTEIFDAAIAADASKPTVTNIARTVNSFITWAVDHGYFLESEPFGEPRRRRSIVKRAHDVARFPSNAEGVSLSYCPTMADILKLATAFEDLYPGYGERLVLLALGSGLRINELLAVRHDSIDLATGEIRVDSQLDRSQAWPAVKLPKGEKRRVAVLWAVFTDVAESLIEDSLTRSEDDPHHGWLFPRHRSTTAWADKAGHLAGDAISACDWSWTFHWLRHAYASYSLAPTSAGGFELELPSVSKWLGHSKTSVTQDMYLERQAGDVPRARKATSRLPGLG